MKRLDLNDDTRNIPISSDADIVEARLVARALAQKIGFSGVDLVLIATAVSEVARNIVEYADHGEVKITVVHRGNLRRGLQVVAWDQGPGIVNLGRAMEDGYSTSRGLGLGLPGARRLMDEFHISSTPGEGTTVTLKKWLP